MNFKGASAWLNTQLLRMSYELVSWIGELENDLSSTKDAFLSMKKDLHDEINNKTAVMETKFQDFSRSLHISVNNEEQHDRLLNLRIHGLPSTKGENCIQAVLDFLHTKLQLPTSPRWTSK